MAWNIRQIYHDEVEFPYVALHEVHQQLGRKPPPLGVGRNAELFNSVKDKKEDFWVK